MDDFKYFNSLEGFAEMTSKISSSFGAIKSIEDSMKAINFQLGEGYFQQANNMLNTTPMIDMGVINTVNFAVQDINKYMVATDAISSVTLSSKFISEITTINTWVDKMVKPFINFDALKLPELFSKSSHFNDLLNNIDFAETETEEAKETREILTELLHTTKKCVASFQKYKQESQEDILVLRNEFSLLKAKFDTKNKTNRYKDKGWDLFLVFVSLWLSMYIAPLLQTPVMEQPNKIDQTTPIVPPPAKEVAPKAISDSIV